MRVIDVDDFFNRMENDTDICAEMEKDGLKALKKYLDMQPTAYDVDNVIKQLSEWTFNADINIGDGMMMNHNLIVSKNAIEIVKAGGKEIVVWDEYSASWCLTKKSLTYKYFFGEAQMPEDCEVIGNTFDRDL